MSCKLNPISLKYSACLNTNRNFIGIELDENYFNISKKRVEEKRKEKDLQAGTLFGDEM